MKIFKTNKFVDIWHVVELVALVLLLGLCLDSVHREDVWFFYILAIPLIPDTIVFYFILRFASKSDAAIVTKIVIMSIKFAMVLLLILIFVVGIFNHGATIG